ncbi:MAG: hypothetical protein HeimC2_27550 [Candidatus Heimdallarchaeota archaeon LC_2]|nr:MAG: hypothetical protein HeimC2_27550 [Candidatus Heimdallarchaeota archaeon LC_2]
MPFQEIVNNEINGKSRLINWNYESLRVEYQLIILIHSGYKTFDLI